MSETLPAFRHEPGEPMPRYYFPGEVKALRDQDRKRYCRNVILLVLYQIALAVPVRYSIDTLLANPKLEALQFVRPHVLPGIAVLVLLIWVFGIKTAFARRY